MELEKRVKLLNELAENVDKYKQGDRNIQSPLLSLLREGGIYHSDPEVNKYSLILFGKGYYAIKAVIFIVQPSSNCLSLYTQAGIPVYFLAENSLTLIQQTEKPVIRSINSQLCNEYKKYLLGCPLEKLDLDPSLKDKLRKFIRAASPGRSLFEIQEECIEVLSSQTCWNLKQVQKRTHSRIKTLKSRYSLRKVESFVNNDPQIAEYVRKTSRKAKKTQNKAQV